MAERRSLTDEEKRVILERDGMRCFIDGHPIESEDELEFDHIIPVAGGGASTIANMTPVCRKHNRAKGTRSLSEYRDQLQLDGFFRDGEPKYLDDIITAKGRRFGDRLQFEINSDGSSIILYFDAGKKMFTLYTCPATKWPYFYALIPTHYLRNDRDLQPRALRQKSMWDLYRHFQRNTQLAPSICRFDDQGTLMLFDGQHKAAAQIWAGREAVECKVYIRPLAHEIKETNLDAHQNYRQMAFYSYELMRKYADICGENWTEYAALEGPKSEQGFVEFLMTRKKLTTAKAKDQVAQAVYWRILKDPDNKLRLFIAEETRARRQPLTVNRIEKTMFRQLLSPIPNSAEFESDTDFRATEEQNVVRVMTIIAEEGLIDRWNPELDDATHKRTERIFSAGAIRAWTSILHDVLNAYLQLYLKGQEEAKRILYRPLTEEQFSWIRKFVHQLFSHHVWDAPDTSDQDLSKRLTKDDDTTAKLLLTDRGLTVEWVLQSAAGK